MRSKALTASRSLLPRWLQSLRAKEAIARPMPAPKSSGTP